MAVLKNEFVKRSLEPTYLKLAGHIRIGGHVEANALHHPELPQSRHSIIL
jgi:hypothetical protein